MNCRSEYGINKISGSKKRWTVQSLLEKLNEHWKLSKSTAIKEIFTWKLKLRIRISQLINAERKDQHCETPYPSEIEE